MQLLQSLITAINKGFSLRAQPHFRFLEQPKVVAAPFVVRDAQDAARRFLNDKLRFYRVPLLLARVVSPLSFLAAQWAFQSRQSGYSITK